MKVYDVFIEGAREGFDVAVKIIPFLVGILAVIGMFRGSGAMNLVTRAPADCHGHRLSRGARAAREPSIADGKRFVGPHHDVVKKAGPESLLARTAATMYGSSETTFYVHAV